MRLRTGYGQWQGCGQQAIHIGAVGRAMCGRFTQRCTWREIHDLYGLTGAARNLQAHYNIALTDAVEVVKFANGGITALVPMRWELIPYWWKKPNACHR